MLALLCAAGMTHRRGAVLAVAVAITVPFTAADLVDARRGAAERVELEDDLAGLLDDHRSEIARCPRVYVPSFRLVPLLVQELDTPSERFTRQRPAAGALFIGLPADAGRDHVVDPLQPDPPPPGARNPPPGFRTLAASDRWVLSADC